MHVTQLENLYISPTQKQRAKVQRRALSRKKLVLKQCFDLTIMQVTNKIHASQLDGRQFIRMMGGNENPQVTLAHTEESPAGLMCFPSCLLYTIIILLTWPYCWLKEQSWDVQYVFTTPTEHDHYNICYCNPLALSSIQYTRPGFTNPSIISTDVEEKLKNSRRETCLMVGAWHLSIVHCTLCRSWYSRLDNFLEAIFDF